jgi:hypothetical protein
VQVIKDDMVTEALIENELIWSISEANAKIILKSVNL